MDVKFVKPFFYRGHLFAWLANTGHWPDIGGSVPGGYSARATEIEQEGLRLPPVRLFKAGKLDEEILAIIMSNIRVAGERIGDIKAQAAALDVGEQRLTELIDRYGDGVVEEAISELRSRAARQMRAKIARIPDGIYKSETFVDSDGVDDAPLRIRLSITKAGEDLFFDLSEFEPAVPWADEQRHLDHAVRDLPRHQACLPRRADECRDFRCSPCREPKGTFLFAEYPRPVSGCSAEVSQRIAEAVFAALVEAIPDKLFAASAGTCGNMGIGGYDPEKRPHYVMYYFTGGGYGGSTEIDGLSNGCSITGISKMQPVEVLEQLFPVLFEEFSLAERSAGAGYRRGGFGVQYAIRLRRGQARASFVMDHGRFGLPAPSAAVTRG